MLKKILLISLIFCAALNAKQIVIATGGVNGNYFKVGKDINTKVYPAIKEMQLSDLKTYFDNNIKGKNYAFLVIGNKKLVDKKALSEQGEYKELTLEEIFGY